ncbi:G1/S-specific cyclin-E protein [Rhynchospora pubera]|uniref:G1/S-specific cyclin-E protein n=1 Tax=Rhynchospora pubera TaxID=906938 RepID=A0AAV8CQ22_9POAL|nr:G1/S-specific cyclin-E protein [Rhynchospora pubera]
MRGSSSTVHRNFFPLTNLQIGDLQSYLSRLSIFLTPSLQKLYFLVDNGPWLVDEDIRPAHLWQLMVTKSRSSPFANSKTRRRRCDSSKRLNCPSTSRPTPMRNNNQQSRWYSLIDAAMQQKGALLPVEKLKDPRMLNKELHRTLYGFIVFEVEWANVRGINYLNELQNDTSMALEVKILRRWEFDSIELASTLLSSWFPGSFSELRMLQEYLDSMCPKGDVFYDAPADSSGCCSDSSGFSSRLVGSTLKEQLTHAQPPSSGPYKRRKIMTEDKESYSEIMSTPRSLASSISDSDTSSPSCEATSYRNAFVLFKFDDHDLPFKLREVIMSDLRLLTLLEYGLPSWVMFLQSYPLFCKMYRPWMCSLARFLYVLMSIITVLIGFYDLYKHVPLMNATLSKLFGPFFEWIENWEMISRIQYLGTMLFLHNFEQTVKWALQVMRSVKSFFSVLTQPVVGPLMEIVEFVRPVWNLLGDTMKYIGSSIWLVLGTSWSVVTGLLEFIIWPFELVLSTVLNIASYILSPILWILGEVMSLPFRVVFMLSNLVSAIFLHMYYMLIEIGSYIFSMFQVASASKATATGVAYEASVLKSLWNDLFSQVFRAVRSILNGLVAFFSTCNRHRLSIYNYILGIRVCDFNFSIYNYILGILEGLSHSRDALYSESTEDSRDNASQNNPKNLTKYKTW